MAVVGRRPDHSRHGSPPEPPGDPMPLHHEVKTVIIDKYKRGEADTGSPEVQVALMTQRIQDLTEHFKIHKHDHHSRRGLFLLAGKRRRLLNWLKKIDVERYRTLIAELGIRK